MPQENKEDFLAIKPLLEQWGKTVDDTIIKLVEEKNDANFIKIKPKFRVKTLNSYLRKVEVTKADKYKNPIIDATDKVATRVVVLSSEDTKKVAELLKKSSIWTIREDRDFFSERLANPSSFAYESLHYIVWPVVSDIFPDIEANKKLSCEIQIRTLLQHAYAEVSHDSTYKGGAINDKEILRNLAKSMALIEATDDYFCKVISLLNDSSREANQLIDHIIKKYEELSLKPIDKSPSTYEAFFSLINFFYEAKIPSGLPKLSEIDLFIESQKTSIKHSIDTKEEQIFKEPYYLLAGYILKFHFAKSEEYWPLSAAAKSQVMYSIGISPGNQ